MYRIRHAGTPEQIAFWGMPNKFRAFVGGIGSGKTRAGALEIFRQPSGSSGMVIAPTYDMLKAASLETFFEIAEATGDPASSMVAHHDRSELVTTLKNATKIRWRSGSDPSRLRGANLNWFWLDEGAYLKNHDVWRVAIGRLRRQGTRRAWVTTSPNGFNWLYETFVTDGVEKRPEKFGLVHASTRGNTFLDPEFVEDLLASYTTDYAAQEVEGQFVDLGSTMVKREWLRYLAVVAKGLIITMGVDLAISKKTTADSTAIVVVGRRPGSGVAYVLDAVDEQVSFNEGLALIRRMAAKWKPSAIRIEKVAFQESTIEQLIMTTRLPIVAVERPPGIDKITRFVPVATRYERGAIYHAPSLQGGKFEKQILGFPVGSHDDYNDALELAVIAPSSSPVATSGGKPAIAKATAKAFGLYRYASDDKPIKGV